MSGLIDAALALAAQGLPVFPCWANKKPVTRHGFHEASKRPEHIRKLFARPHQLIGVPTGAASGIALLDLDPRHNGHEWGLANCARIPRTRVHGTQSDGFHLLFKHREGLTNSQAGIAPGVDVRGEGGYAIWWPAHGCEVIDDTPLDDLAPWPEWIVVPTRQGNRPDTSSPRVVTTRQIEGICNRVCSATEGERNSLLFWGACRLAELLRPGILSEAQAEALLLDAASRAGLEPRGAAATIRSGFSRSANS